MALLLLAHLAAETPTPALASPALRPTAPQFFALSVADAAAGARWCRDVFSLAVRREIRPPGAPVHLFILESPELVVELLQHPDARPLTQVPDRYRVHGVFKVGFSVPDLASAVQTLKAKGVAFAYDITADEATGLRFAIFKDNSGNLIRSSRGGAYRNPNGPDGAAFDQPGAERRVDGPHEPASPEGAAEWPAHGM